MSFGKEICLRSFVRECVFCWVFLIFDFFCRGGEDLWLRLGFKEVVFFLRERVRV